MDRPLLRQGAMLEKYHKPETIDELKVVWEQLPQDHVNKAVANFTKRLTRLPMVDTSSICSTGLSTSKSASSSQHQKTGSFQTHPHIAGKQRLKH